MAEDNTDGGQGQVPFKIAHEHLARMVALRGYDSSIVEDADFRSFVSCLNPDFQLPSRRDIEKMCDGAFDEAKRDLRSKLERTSGRVNLAFGTNETSKGTVLYMACHFIDDEWKLHKMISGVYMLAPTVDYYGPLLGVGEACSEHLEKAVAALMHNHIQHKIFSTAWCGVQQFDGCIEGSTCHIHPTDDVLHSVAKRLRDYAISNYPLLIFRAVDDLRLTRQEREENLSYLGLDELLTYKKDWYSMYCSFEVVFRPSTAAEETTFKETTFTVLLHKFFGEIYRAIRTISAPSSPTSNLCLRELFKVREVLQYELARASGDQAEVADVLGEAKNILDSGIKKAYLEWSVPLVLDPRYKLRYIKFIFNRAFGFEAENYISEVTTKIKDLFTDYSKGGQTTDGEHDRSLLDKTELDRYLDCMDDLVRKTDDLFDILDWWKVNSSKYPTVARMARDALAMPTCSELTAEQINYMRSMVRGYSKVQYEHQAW